MSTFSPFVGGEERITTSGKKMTARAATRPMYTPTITEDRKLRVAAYARVSTDHEEQATSYEAQIDYYTRYIQSRPDMEFCGMYADEGISAVTTARREGFKQMIADALDGKFDRILTKSVSRFARNTVDSLTTIRKLKDKGIGVTFEKENIDTLDSKGELLITLMSSLAQEESRSISENTTWGQRKRFSDGKVNMPFSRFLGYDRGENGEPVVNEGEAETVRRIYKLFLDGMSTSAMARLFTNEGIPTPGGKVKWQSTTIESILTNEKYRGDALLQKSFCVDFLTKKMKKNEGEVQSFYVKDSHPAIVSGEVFELAQSELRRRRESGRRICSGSVFAGKIICGECGGLFGSKVWGSNTKYRKIIWRCNNKYGGKKDEKQAERDEKASGDVPNGVVQPEQGKVLKSEQPDFNRHTPRCSSPHLTEAQIQNAFIAMVNGMVENSTDILSFYDDLIAKLTDTAALEAEKGPLEAEGAIISKDMQELIAENARTVMRKEDYDRRYNELNNKFTIVKNKLTRINDAIRLKGMKKADAEAIMSIVRGGLITKFDSSLFGGIVDCVVVYKDGLVFQLKDGSERRVDW